MINLEDKVAGEELANSIEAAVPRARGLTNLTLGIALAGNSLTLSGRVPELWQKDMAESIVRTFGLVHIQYNIEVAPEHASLQTP
ncbi:MAG: BON domain-containing protein [Planctomycetota bacterium]|nr:MAG: BON domain-containing protein [Planctomycetota bacterium]REJ95802.1 MAG: BON domain-containing protein [Planctomycetota bacterium]